MSSQVQSSWTWTVSHAVRRRPSSAQSKWWQTKGRCRRCPSSSRRGSKAGGRLWPETRRMSLSSRWVTVKSKLNEWTVVWPRWRWMGGSAACFTVWASLIGSLMFCIIKKLYPEEPDYFFESTEKMTRTADQETQLNSTNRMTGRAMCRHRGWWDTGVINQDRGEQGKLIWTNMQDMILSK